MAGNNRMSRTILGVVFSVSFASASFAQDALPPSPDAAPLASDVEEPPPPVAPPTAPAPLDAPQLPPTPPTPRAEAAVVGAPNVLSDAEEEPLPVAGWNEGFFIQSPDGLFKIKIGAKIQPRFTVELPDGDEDDDEYNFMIRRLQPSLSGHVFSKDLTYKLSLDFGRGSVDLDDAYGDYRLVKGLLHVRAGQYKKPFNRQQINSSGRLALVDRSPTNKAFGGGRDIGVMLHNRYSKSPLFEYAVGLFNGTGTKRTFDEENLEFSNVPDQLDPLLVARIGYNHGGGKGYSEADLEGGGVRFGIGASAQLEFDADGDDDGAVRGNFDYYLKAHGFATTGGLYVASDEDAETRKFADQKLSATGMHLQASVLLADVLLPAVRYSRVMPDGADNDEQEIIGGLGVLPYGHKFKVQLDAGATIAEQEGGESTTDVRVRTQMTLHF